MALQIQQGSNSSGNASSSDDNTNNNDNNSSQSGSTSNNSEGTTSNDSDSASGSSEQEEKSSITLNTNSVVIQKGKTINTVKVTLINDEIDSVTSANTKIATVSHKENVLSIKGLK